MYVYHILNAKLVDNIICRIILTGLYDYVLLIELFLLGILKIRLELLHL